VAEGPRVAQFGDPGDPDQMLFDFTPEPHPRHCDACCELHTALQRATEQANRELAAGLSPTEIEALRSALDRILSTSIPAADQDLPGVRRPATVQYVKEDFS
jgi:hypothetical protein